MHTLGPDAQNLLELLRGYIAAEQHGSHTPSCPITTLGIADVLSKEEQSGGTVTLRNVAVILDDVGRTSPTRADMLAGHYAVATAIMHHNHTSFAASDVFSVNGSHPEAPVQLTIDYATGQIGVTREGTTLTDHQLEHVYDVLLAHLWVTHSAALLGVLTRIADAVHATDEQLVRHRGHESVRAFVYAGADRLDHAFGRGPYRDTIGFGARYDVLPYASLIRTDVLAFLDELAAQCEPPLHDALGVVSGRARHTFGAPSQPSAHPLGLS